MEFTFINALLQRKNEQYMLSITILLYTYFLCYIHIFIFCNKMKVYKSHIFIDLEKKTVILLCELL